MTSEVILDLNTINELKEMLEDSFAELFILFKENSRGYIDQLKKAHEENNVEDILKYAHVLKGSCGSLGLKAMYELLIKLETSLREDSNADISASVLELESLYLRTMSDLVANGYLEI